MTKEETREPTLKETITLANKIEDISCYVGIFFLISCVPLVIACLVWKTILLTLITTIVFSIAIFCVWVCNDKQHPRDISNKILKSTMLGRKTFMHKLYKGLWHSIAFERIVLNAIKTFIVIIDTLMLCLTLPLAFLFAFPDLAFGVGSWIWLLFALEKEKGGKE